MTAQRGDWPRKPWARALVRERDMNLYPYDSAWRTVPDQACRQGVSPAFGTSAVIGCVNPAMNFSPAGVPPVTEYTAFKVELTDNIAHVQINRPEKINAMNAAFWEEIVDIFQWIDDTDAVRVVVISGAGKHFSSGIDLMMLASLANQLGKDVGRNARLLRRKILRLQASFNAVDNCRKPVLAAIQGYCIGGAIDLISACDMRYCAATRSSRSRKSTSAWPPMSAPCNVCRVSSATACCVNWPSPGARRCRRGARIGLVNRVYATTPPARRRLAIAREIAAKSPIAVAGTKEMISYMRDHRIDDGLEYIATWNAAMLQSKTCAWPWPPT
jgi:enoyl-CoA hydratase